MEADSMNDSEKLKILFVTHNYPRWEGDYSGVFLHLLATKLLDFGIQVHVVAPHDRNAEEYEELDGIKIHRFKYADSKSETLAYRGNMHRQLMANPFKTFTLLKFIRKAAAKAIEIIDQEQIKIASIHWVVPNCMIATRLKKHYGDRLITTLHSHGTDARIINKMYPIYLMAKPAMEQAEVWTVVSTFIKRLILERNTEVADKIRVFPMPNDETIFFPDETVKKKKNLVVAVSRLTNQKRLPYLIRAVYEASQKIPDITLEIYGSGPERGNLKRLIRELGAEKTAFIKSPVPQKELRVAYNRAALVVLNSLEEGFGLALTEAMLCRTPVIGAESGGIVDIIEHDKTGLLVEPGNWEILRDTIVSSLENDYDRGRLAEAGYQKALAKFSSDSAAQKFAELFKSLVI